MKKGLSIDYGKKRTGLAVSDPLQLIAGGLATVPTATLFDYLTQYLSHEDVECIVIGKPLQPNGQPSENLQRVEQFVNRWRKAFPQVPIEYYDERYTSVLAHQAMIDAGRVSVQEGDVSNLTLDAGKFDLATAFETIYFWPGLAKCFGEVRKILKPDGKFMVVTESDGRDKISQWFKARIDGMNTYTADEIESALKAAGFSSVTINHHAKFPWLMLLATK